MLSYSPKKLPTKLKFPVAINQANHQDGSKDAVKVVLKIRGEFIMSTADNNEEERTVTKCSRFSKHGLMFIVGEPRFVCRGNFLFKFSTQLVVARTSATLFRLA